MLESWVWLYYLLYCYVFKIFFPHEKENLSLRLAARVKEGPKSRGPVWDAVMEGGDVKQKGATLQMAVLCSRAWEAPLGAAGRSSSGQWDKHPWPSPSCPVRASSLCSTESQGSLPGSQDHARLCQVCGWYLPGRHLHTWIDGFRLTIFWVTLSPLGRNI